MAGGGEGGGRYGLASGRRISTYRSASSCRCRRSGSTAVTPPSTCGAIPPPPGGGTTTTTYARSPGEYNDAPAPGDNVAYLQLGVPTYRISQMVEYGGNAAPRASRYARWWACDRRIR
jgi:hypothetical protein